MRGEKRDGGAAGAGAAGAGQQYSQYSTDFTYCLSICLIVASVISKLLHSTALADITLTALEVMYFVDFLVKQLSNKLLLVLSPSYMVITL